MSYAGVSLLQSVTSEDVQRSQVAATDSSESEPDDAAAAAAAAAARAGFFAAAAAAGLLEREAMRKRLQLQQSMRRAKAGCDGGEGLQSHTHRDVMEAMSARPGATARLQLQIAITQPRSSPLHHDEPSTSLDRAAGGGPLLPRFAARTPSCSSELSELSASTTGWLQ